MKANEKIHKTRYLAFLVVAALMGAALFGLAGCGGDDSSSSSSGDVDEKYANLDNVTLVFGGTCSKDSAQDQWSTAISKYASEITGGKLTLDWHGYGDLGDNPDLLRQLQANDIQMYSVQPSPMVSFVPKLAAFDLPLVFAQNTPDEIDSVLNGDNAFSQGIQEAYNESGLHLLGWLQDGTYRQTTANRDLSTLEDFKGFQIRTMENSNNMAFWSAIGAEPTPLAFSELYFALQNGTVDGEENAVDTCVGQNYFEVQDHLAMTKHLLYVNQVCINKDCWDNLDPAYQDAINEAVQRATDDIRPTLTTLEEDSVQVFKDKGCTVIEYDDSFFEEVLANEGVQQLYKDISGQTDGLSDLLVEELKKAKSA